MNLEEKVKKHIESKDYFDYEELKVMCNLSEEELDKVKYYREMYRDECKESRRLYDTIERYEQYVQENYGSVALAQMHVFDRMFEEQEEELQEYRSENSNLRYTMGILRKELKKLGVDPDSLDPSLEKKKEEK